MEDRIQKAVEYFMSGYGCCQSVAAAFSDIYGVDETLVLRMAAGFGGGVGRMRMMCGAVSGMVMLAGLDKGQTLGEDSRGKADCYKLVQELLASFKEENGSVICAELLGLGGVKPDCHFVPAERNAQYYKTRPCVAKVESAARIYAAYLQSKA